MEDFSARVHEWFVWVVTGGLILVLWALGRLKEQVQELRYQLDSIQATVDNIEDVLSPTESGYD